ncbi:hypothetical protein J6590_037390 [Homalodisca vitripennis]|nr:hypothetical protein J6590_037390 [Homalodisca vitripennis]
MTSVYTPASCVPRVLRELNVITWTCLRNTKVQRSCGISITERPSPGVSRLSKCSSEIRDHALVPRRGSLEVRWRGRELHNRFGVVLRSTIYVQSIRGCRSTNRVGGGIGLKPGADTKNIHFGGKVALGSKLDFRRARLQYSGLLEFLRLSFQFSASPHCPTPRWRLDVRCPLMIPRPSHGTPHSPICHVTPGDKYAGSDMLFFE